MQIIQFLLPFILLYNAVLSESTLVRREPVISTIFLYDLICFFMTALILFGINGCA